jgi:threonine/homoserine/homoserine lactone efflux protein
LPQEDHQSHDTQTPHFFREAFLTGLSNPKDLLFFILFLPQFVDPSLALWQAAAILMLLWFVCDFGIMCSVGLLADVLKSVLTGHRQFIMARVLSMIMMVLGGILFVSTVVSLLL